MIPCPFPTVIYFIVHVSSLLYDYGEKWSLEIINNQQLLIQKYSGEKNFSFQ